MAGEHDDRLLQTSRLKVTTALVPETRGKLAVCPTLPSLPARPLSTGVSAGAAGIRLSAKWSYLAGFREQYVCRSVAIQRHGPPLR